VNTPEVDHIQDRSEAIIYGHDADALLIEEHASAMEAMRLEARDLYEEWGMSEEGTVRAHRVS